MKKLFLLTSVLALAACGGGSGGGGSHGGADSMDLTLPVGVRAAVTDDVASSNGHVTNMKSEVLVATKNGRSQVVRSSVPVTNDSGVTFISYDLSDVKLRPAAFDVPENAYLQIGINDETKQVNSMTMFMGELNGEQIGGAVARIDDSEEGYARFRGPMFEYIEDEYAEVEDTEFHVANTVDALTAAMKTAAATKYGFSTPANWVEVAGKWQYTNDGGSNYEQIDTDHNGSPDTVFAVTIGDKDAMEAAIKRAYSFDDGKWVSVDDERKYVVFGNNSVYRIADNGELTMPALNTMASDLRLPALGHWNRLVEEMEVVSLGGDAGLQYSDFGHLNSAYHTKQVDLTDGSGDTWTATLTKSHNDDEIEDIFDGKDYQLFAGGYAINGTTLQSTLDAPRNTTFRGNAIGRVYVSIESNQGGVEKDDELAAWNVTSGDGHDIAQDYMTSTAQLVVGADGKETLTMPFSGFYTVNVEKTGNGAPEFTFTDTAGVMTASQYRKNNNPDPESVKQNFRPGYYGVGIASEAAGTVYYKTTQDVGIGADAGKVDREWEFQGAYGLKK